MLRCVGGDVYADFGKGFDRQGMHAACRFASVAGNTELPFGGGAENPLGHVTTAGIAGAKHQYKRCGDLSVHLAN